MRASVVRQRKLYEEVAAQLEQMIADGQYASEEFCCPPSGR